MTMHARIAKPVVPAVLDDAFAARRRNAAPRACRPHQPPASVAIHGPSLVIVVPDKLDAVLGACREAGGKNVPRPLWTLALLLLLAL
ncbi:hypothetical protein SAMN05519104_0166 [Rhizobiales bacterium GAS188]|nr:hypothetical protein SAMN05519104_0166 [Rhizobiales bacterium GAS188]